MNRYFLVILSLTLLISLSGCATTWQYIDKNDAVWKHSHFEARLPMGWVKCNAPSSLLGLTKDGLALQQISLTKHKTESDKEFPKTKKKIKEGMLSQEIADLIINEMSLNREIFLNFQIIENKPAKIGGIDGFKIIFTYNNEDFMKSEVVYYGFILKKQFYSLQYIAAKQHYFERDLADFEWFVDNFNVKK